MNPERLKLPKSKPAPVAASSHRAGASMPTEASNLPAVRVRKFTGLDPFTMSLVATAPLVPPVARVAPRRVTVKASPAPAVVPKVVPEIVPEPIKKPVNRGVLALGAMLAVGVAGAIGLRGRTA